MRKRDVLALLWVVPPTLLAAMWVRSCRTMDEVAGVDGGNVLRGAVSYRGAVHLIRSEQNSTPRRVTWDTCDVPATATWRNLYPPDDSHWRWLGFAKFGVPRAGPPPAATAPVALRGAIPPPAGPGGGVAGVRNTPATRPAVVRIPAIPVARPRLIAPWLFSRRYTAYAVPYWAPLAVAIVPAVLAVTRFVRRWSRARRGRCPGCGYDLRMTADRCPECGEAIAGRATATA